MDLDICLIPNTLLMLPNKQGWIKIWDKCTMEEDKEEWDKDKEEKIEKKSP